MPASPMPTVSRSATTSPTTEPIPPRRERLMDIELGYNYHANNWYAGVNLYYMDYTNQFVQTGAQSDIGENLTTNIKGQLPHGCRDRGWLVAAELPHPGEMLR